VADLKEMVVSLTRSLHSLQAERDEQRALLKQLLADRCCQSQPQHPETRPDPVLHDQPRQNTANKAGQCVSNAFDPHPSQSYAEILRSGLSEKKEHTMTSKHRNDVDEQNSNDAVQINSSENHRNRQGMPSSRDLPKVLVLHDSVLSKINSDRLGRSYGFHCASRRVHKIKECSDVSEEAKESLHPSPDCVVVSFGLNDLKAKDPVTCAEDFKACVKNLKDTFKNSRIVVNKVAPVRNMTLEKKRTVFNAHVFSHLYTEKDVSFVTNDNIGAFSSRHLYDGIHPTNQGAALLAGNVGRHVHSLFWERPQRRHDSRRPRRHQPSSRQAARFHQRAPPPVPAFPDVSFPGPRGWLCPRDAMFAGPGRFFYP
jgi:hypothetical protein